MGRESSRASLEFCLPHSPSPIQLRHDPQSSSPTPSIPCCFLQISYFHYKLLGCVCSFTVFFIFISIHECAFVCLWVCDWANYPSTHANTYTYLFSQFWFWYAWRYRTLKNYLWHKTTLLTVLHQTPRQEELTVFRVVVFTGLSANLFLGWQGVSEAVLLWLKAHCNFPSLTNSKSWSHGCRKLTKLDCEYLGLETIRQQFLMAFLEILP